MRLSSNHISPLESNVDNISAFGVFTMTDGGILSLKTGALAEDLAAEIQNTAVTKLTVSLSFWKKSSYQKQKSTFGLREKPLFLFTSRLK